MKTTIPLITLALISLGLATTACKQKCDCAKKSSDPKKGTNAAAHDQTPGGKLELSTDAAKLAYFGGFMQGKNLKTISSTLPLEALKKGAQDGFAEAKSLVSRQEIRPIIMRLQKKAMEEAKAKRLKEAKDPARLAAAKKNEEAGKAFLEKNKSVKGVKTHPSGIQYMVLKEGTGPKPTAQDSVTCHYKGTLLDGKEFDSSYKRGKPATFSLGRVVKGWQIGIPLMSVGSKYKFWIPGNLAYGMNPRPGGPIKPMDLLVFEVELLSIKGKPAAASKGTPAQMKPQKGKASPK